MAVAVQPSFRFDAAQYRGVVIGVYSFDTDGFDVITPRRSDATALVGLRRDVTYSTEVSLPFAPETAGSSPYELPFYVSLPAGQYSLFRTQSPIPRKVRVLKMRSGSTFTGNNQPSVRFDVAPNAVTCVGHMHLRVELEMQLSGNVAPSTGRWEVTDNCAQLIEQFQRLFPDVKGTMRTALARR